MTREEKSKVIEVLTAELADNANIYLADISGLNADTTSNLRRACFKANVRLAVVKNTLLEKAMEASGYNHRMGVWWCASGCDGNVVMVRFHHKDFAGQAEDYGQPLADMIAKYEEMYGEGSYEQDSDKVDASLLENGRKFRHYRFRPEMSSPIN